MHRRTVQEMENVGGGHEDQSHRHHGALTLCLPCSPPGGGNGNGNPRRDDCWSEGATVTLIQSWGDRYLALNWGNLKQKHWQEVAEAVNGNLVRKSEAQCKNRLDTPKKKYKLHKTEICSGAGGIATDWPYFDRLDGLIGPSRKNHRQQQAKLLQPSDPGPRSSAGNKRPAEEEEWGPPAVWENSGSPDMTESWPAGADDGGGYCNKRSRPPGSPLKDLARAILRFGEVYEKIETSKQQQLIDLEKQRMEFTKDLELQRMHLFMQTQLELAKMKHGNNGSSTEHYL